MQVCSNIYVDGYVYMCSSTFLYTHAYQHLNSIANLTVVLNNNNNYAETMLHTYININIHIYIYIYIYMYVCVYVPARKLNGESRGGSWQQQ